MKFPYERQLDPHGPELRWTSRPIVRVKLSFGDRQLAVLALIDSGADVTLFHVSLAKALGIQVQTGREGRVFGISGERMPIYYHTLRLQLEDSANAVDMEAGFVDSPSVGALLGQSGFFEHFRVCLDRKNEEIEIFPSH